MSRRMGKASASAGSRWRSGTQRGLSLLTFAVFGVIFIVVGYSAYVVIPFYYYFYDLKNQFEQVIKVASVETDEEIRRKLMAHLKRYQIPCEPEDLKIERSGEDMTVSLEYQEVFSIPWRGKEYVIHKFDFDATVSGKFK